MAKLVNAVKTHAADLRRLREASLTAARLAVDTAGIGYKDAATRTRAVQSATGVWRLLRETWAKVLRAPNAAEAAKQLEGVTYLGRPFETRGAELLRAAAAKEREADPTVPRITVDVGATQPARRAEVVRLVMLGGTPRADREEDLRRIRKVAEVVGYGGLDRALVTALRWKDTGEHARERLKMLLDELRGDG